MPRWVMTLVVVMGCKGRTEEATSAPPRLQASTPAAPVTAVAATDGGLPEAGPHPDYPTASAAGTDKIFSLEDPDRGPTAPRTIAIPRDLAWTIHEHCADDPVALVCSPAVPRARGLVHWRVGRTATMIVADAMLGAGIGARHVYVQKADGTPIRHVDVDAYGVVETAWMFATPGRYSARERNGENALRGCGSMAYSLDAAKRIAELRCLQWLGEPMHDTTGVVTRRYVRDARGFLREEHRLGADGAPIVATDGVATVVFERDEVGRLLASRHRDPSGASVADEDGCHGWRYAYNLNGSLVRETCLGADDKPVRALSGIATTAHAYDNHGCRTRQRYLTPDEQPATDHDGVHGSDERRVPISCKLTSSTCVDRAGLATACAPEAPARTVYQRDVAGRVISTKHYGADDKPAGDSAYGVFELRYGYDDLGNERRQSCWDVDGKPIECGGTGFHASLATFDAAGRETARTFVDTAGQPTTNVGITTARFQYDNYDHVFEVKNLDADGKLVPSFGAAIRRELYDAAHRRFGVLLFDVAGKPARYEGCYTGSTCPDGDWHAVRIVRRRDGSVEKNLFFDAGGQLTATQSCTTMPCFR